MIGDDSHPDDEPLLPDYGGACVTGLVPALLEGSHEPDWLSHDLLAARRVLLLVLDGLGWNQLQQRRDVAPVLAALDGQPITTVSPTTTSAALTSISTGLPPGDHGVVGYRISVDGSVLNALRWTTAEGDARRRIDPAVFQPYPAFGDQYPPVVTRAEFVGSGFTRAHLSATRLVGYTGRHDMVDRTVGLLAAGEPFVYAYWDGIDRIAHEHGLGGRYDEELADCDAMVAALIDRVPPGTAVVVTADHGQVHVGERILDLPPEVTSCLEGQSGEARFRWLHSRPGAAADLRAAAIGAFGQQAWIRTLHEVEAECWLGPRLGSAARSRLGDVALVARGQVAFRDPAEVMSIDLIGRHGSLTPDEVLVPAVGIVA